MGNQNTNRAVADAVDGAAYWVVSGAATMVVDGDVRDAVNGAVFRAVGRAVHRAVYWAAVEDSPHPALQDFLGEVGGT